MSSSTTETSPAGTRRVVYAALLGNIAVTVTKFVAAALTGSSAMLSEGVHSLIDTGNEVLLLYGLRRAAVPPDEEHPFGHGREVYFWSFVVAVLIFGVGAGVSFYEGVQHVLSPHPIERPAVNYVVIALALVFEGASWRVAYREFREGKGDTGTIEAAVRSKDPTTFMVLFEDSAALIGLLLALAGTVLSVVLDRPVIDGVASLLIGVLLGVVAAFLARESKGLLIGESADAAIVKDICAIASSHPDVERSNGLFTVHLGPRQVLAGVSVDFRDDITAGDVERIVAELEDRVRERHPEVVSLLVKPQSADGFRRLLARNRARF